MAESGGSAGFLLKTAQAVLIMGQRGFEYLDGDVPSQPFIAGTVNFAHPSRAYLFEHPIVTQDFTNHANLKRRLSGCYDEAVVMSTADLHR
jgi:hypothetical protein